MKSVDSSCPDPFNEPEKFSVYFAQKSISMNSLSDEFDECNVITLSNASSTTVTEKAENNSIDAENALLRLQNLRMEEQRGFQIERENFETSLGQLSLLQQEIELLRKQNSEHEIQIDFLKSQNNNSVKTDPEIELLRIQLNKEVAENKVKIDELTSQISLKNDQISQLNEAIEISKELKESEKQNCQESEIEELKQTNDQLKAQLDETLLQLQSLQEKLKEQEEKECQVREISEENVRLKIEFADLKKELTETKTQLADLEVRSPKLIIIIIILFLEGTYFINNFKGGGKENL